MKPKLILFAFAASLTLNGCGPAADAPAAPEPVPVVVPAAYVGVWSSSNCERPYVRFGESEIRNMGEERAVPLTSANTFPDGRLVVTYVGEQGAVTETWKLVDGKLDLVTTVSPDGTEDWASDPMSRCPAPTPLDG
jgi:hypothetical protein